jgi:hypothetical protein
MTGFTECMEAVRAAAPGLDERQVEDLFEEIDRRRRQMLAAGQARDLADASEKAAAEFANDTKIAAVIAERERLLNQAKMLGLVAFVKAQFADNPALGLEARAVGVANAKEGARRSAATEQRAVMEEYVGGLRYDLEAGGVYKLFVSNSMQREVSQALWALDQGKTVNVPAEAQMLANIIRKWQEKARLDQNAEGAYIGKLSDYITRQSHDVTLLRKAAGLSVKADDPRHFEAWRDFIRPLLDNERTKLDDKALKEAYVGLVSGDHLKSGGEPSGFKGSRNLAKKASAERVLHFKDADSWLAYNERFGVGSLSEAVVQSLDIAAQNVGLMRVFGTNPGSVMQQAAEQLAKGLRGEPGKLKKFNDRLPAIERMMAYLDGSTRVPENELLAELGMGARLFQSMTKLPMMLLSQFGDLATFASEMKFTHGAGYLQSIGEAVAGLGKGLGDTERNKLLSQIGVFADGMSADLATKFGAADQPRGWMADYQQKFFGLVGARWWNGTMRRRAAEVTSHNLALERKLGYESLPKDLKRSLGLYEIKAEDWNKIRQNVREFEGREFIVPEGIGGETERKLRAFIADRVDYAVLNPGAKTNYYMMWGTDLKRGTAAGEAIRFIGQFKGYPISFIERVLGREVYGRGANTLGEALTNKNGEMVGLAQMIVWSTAMGYLSMTAKELAKGKEPRDISEPDVAWRTFLAASAQGGGLGIYGDFLFGEANRGGRGTASTLLGPMISDVAGVNDLFKRAVRGEAGAGEALKEALKVASGAHPAAAFVVNGYPRIALDYLVLYRIQEELSPGYLRRMESRARNENAQEYLLPPAEYAIR